MMLLESLKAVGRRAIDALRLTGRSTLFLFEALSLCFVPPFKLGRILDQVLFIGVKSVAIVLTTAIFTGMVLGLQGYYTLIKLGSEGTLGSMVALSIIRELGPVLAALMVTGRAGSSIAAEIGIMKLTDQLNALEMMAVNPVKFAITPKLYAGLISMPLLTALFDVVGIAGGYGMGVWVLGVNDGAYTDSMVRAVELADIGGGLVKSVVFGLLISWLCSLSGYSATATTEGITKATTNAVVLSSIAVLIADYLLTALML